MIKNKNAPFGASCFGGNGDLQVSPTKTKSWVLRYTLNKSVRYMGLGSATDWTLAEARERAHKYRQLLTDGIDPQTFREQERLHRTAQETEASRLRRTFAECAKEYHDANADDWKNVKHKDPWINTLTTYAFPVFGKVPMSQLTRDPIREALLPIWKSKAETASRVMQRIRTVDLQSRLWAIPKERMKASRPHTVPLSEGALSILTQAKGLRPELFTENAKPIGLIFLNTIGGALSDMTFTQVLRRMKVDYTMHGFRASFRTWGAEVAHYEHELLEVALAHVVGDATVRGYQKSDIVENRRRLLQEWAEYIRLTEEAKTQTTGGL